ncbi:MAG: thermonuclease family protein [Pseudomonadota bacterium]|nr:MAG: nuclease [Pseudomonadota bacterium]
MSVRMAVVFAAAWLAACSARSEVLRGEVVGISDGDTLTLLDDSKRTHKVRLQGIDAPERSQPFSEKSRQNLARLAFGKRVEVHESGRDRWGRIVGKVMVAPPGCEGCAATLDVGLAQIESGLAWWFRRYAKDQTPEDRAAYEAAEVRAREAKIGLWADSAPLPPWEFRRSKRKR